MKSQILIAQEEFMRFIAQLTPLKRKNIGNLWKISLKISFIIDLIEKKFSILILNFRQFSFFDCFYEFVCLKIPEPEIQLLTNIDYSIARNPALTIKMLIQLNLG